MLSKEPESGIWFCLQAASWLIALSSSLPAILTLLTCSPTLVVSGAYTYVSSAEWSHGGWALAIERVEGRFLSTAHSELSGFWAVREKCIQLRGLVWLWGRQAGGWYSVITCETLSCSETFANFFSVISSFWAPEMLKREVWHLFLSDSEAWLERVCFGTCFLSRG